MEWSPCLGAAVKGCAINTVKSSMETSIIRGLQIGIALIQNAMNDFTKLKKSVVL